MCADWAKVALACLSIGARMIVWTLIKLLGRNGNRATSFLTLLGFVFTTYFMYLLVGERVPYETAFPTATALSMTILKYLIFVVVIIPFAAMLLIAIGMAVLVAKSLRVPGDQRPAIRQEYLARALHAVSALDVLTTTSK